jgi:glycosyltransferase involved in cell wall biosynthesis
MKIMHIITSLKIGGAESALYNLLSQFKKKSKNQHFVIYFHDGPNVQKIKNLGIPLFKIQGLLYKYDPFIYYRLKKLIIKIKPDIMHSALWSANFIGKLLAKKLRIPIICDLHSNFSHDGKIRAFLETFTAHMANRYVAVSQTAYQGYLDTVINKLKKKATKKHIISKLTIIQNGIDITETRKKAFTSPLTKKELGIKKTDFVIGTVGRIEPIKSYDLLINAFAIVVKKIQKEKNIKLCFIGDGSETEKLKQLAIKMELAEHILFFGQRIDAIRFYPIFDCFVLSSISEGLSISILEALCFNLPIISTNRGLQHDIIVNGYNGFLTPIGNKIKLAYAITKLYQNPNLCNKIKTANEKFVLTNFNIIKTKSSYQREYSALFKKKFDF